jgi:transposase
MGRRKWLQELRMQKFESVLDRVRVRELSQLQAAEILGMSERTFRRWRDRHEAEGLAGLFDRRLGKASSRRVPVDEIAWVLEQYRTVYEGWTVKHFHDHLRKHHGFGWSYTWTKTQLHRAGAVMPAPRRGAHRRKRPRRPLIGMLLHQDGSSHHWLEGHGFLDLIVTLDDASSEIYSAFLVEEEGTMSSFSGLLEVIGDHGLPCSFYTDRAGHYFHTAEAGGKVDKTKLTQVGRALAQLGIEHIPAYSPEARGRSERAFATLQDRLVKELKLAGITTIEDANRFIAEVYLPDHNARFAKPPEQPESAFVPATLDQVRDILCRQEERTVGNDNPVRYRGLCLQIPPSPIRPHFVKAKVRVHHYPDGALAVFHGPGRLASYTADGTLIGNDQLAA